MIVSYMAPPGWQIFTYLKTIVLKTLNHHQFPKGMVVKTDTFSCKPNTHCNIE